MSDFFAMDQYATYVWSVYGLAVVMLVANAFMSFGELKSAREQTRFRLKHRQAKPQ